MRMAKSTPTSASTFTTNSTTNTNNSNSRGKEKEQEEANADSLSSKKARVSSLKSTEIQSALSHLDSILSLIDSNSNHDSVLPSGSNPNPNPPGLLQLIPSLLSPLSNLDSVPNHNHSNNQLNLNLHAQKAFLFRNASNLSNTLLAQLNSLTSQTQNASQSTTTTTQHSSQSLDQSFKLVNDLLEVLKSTSQEEIKIKKQVGRQSEIGNDDEEDQINRGNRKRREEKENLLKVRKRRRLMLERNLASTDRDGNGDKDEDGNENGMEKGNDLECTSTLESSYETNLPYSSFAKSSIDFLSKIDSFDLDSSKSTPQSHLQNGEFQDQSHPSPRSGSTSVSTFPTSNRFPTISQFQNLLELLSFWINSKDGDGDDDHELDIKDQKAFLERLTKARGRKNGNDRVGMKVSKWSLKSNGHQPVKKWNDMEINQMEGVKEWNRDLICQTEIDMKDFGRGFIDFEIISDRQRQEQEQEVQEQTDSKEREEKGKDWDLRIVTIRFLSQVEVGIFQKVSNWNSSSNQNQKVNGNGSSSFPLYKDLSSHLLFHSLEDDQENSELKSSEDTGGIKTNKGLINLVKTIFHLTSLRYFFDSPPKSLSIIEQQVRTAEKIEAISLPTVNNSNQTSNSNLTIGDSSNDIQKEIREKNGSLNEKTQVQDGNNLNPKESNKNRRKLWSYRRVLQPTIGDGKIRWVYCSKGIGNLGEGEKLEEDQDGEWRGYHVNCTLRM